MTAALSFLFRALMGGIFLLAGLSKIADPARFLLTLRGFRIFPDIMERFLAVYVPWLELLLGLSLVLGLLYRASALLLSLLNVLFIAAILSVMARGIEIDCGCFGLLADALKLPDAADWRAVIRNSVFIGLLLAVYRMNNTMLSLEAYLRRADAKKD